MIIKIFGIDQINAAVKNKTKLNMLCAIFNISFKYDVKPASRQNHSPESEFKQKTFFAKKCSEIRKWSQGESFFGPLKMTRWQLTQRKKVKNLLLNIANFCFYATSSSKTDCESRFFCHCCRRRPSQNLNQNKTKIRWKYLDSSNTNSLIITLWIFLQDFSMKNFESTHNKHSTRKDF